MFSLFRSTAVMAYIVFVHVLLSKACIYDEDCKMRNPSLSCCCSDTTWDGGECTSGSCNSGYSCANNVCDGDPDDCSEGHYCCAELTATKGACQNTKCCATQKTMCYTDKDCDKGTECCTDKVDSDLGNCQVTCAVKFHKTPLGNRKHRNSTTFKNTAMLI